MSSVNTFCRIKWMVLHLHRLPVVGIHPLSLGQGLILNPGSTRPAWGCLPHAGASGGQMLIQNPAQEGAGKSKVTPTPSPATVSI